MEDSFFKELVDYTDTTSIAKWQNNSIYLCNCTCFLNDKFELFGL